MKLNQLWECGSGETGIIVHVDSSDYGSRRLQELGLYPGQTFEVIQHGETMQVRLGESRLCLRADHVRGVSVIPSPPCFETSSHFENAFSLVPSRSLEPAPEFS